MLEYVHCEVLGKKEIYGKIRRKLGSAVKAHFQSGAEIPMCENLVATLVLVPLQNDLDIMIPPS